MTPCLTLSLISHLSAGSLSSAVSASTVSAVFATVVSADEFCSFTSFESKG